MQEICNTAEKTDANQSNLLALQAKPRRIRKNNRIKIDLSKT